MKNITFILFLISTSFNSLAQKSFEGSIKFKTEISSSATAKTNTKKRLDKKYGDSLIVFYSNNGNIKRQYLNSDVSGNNIQIYDAKKGMLYFKNKKSEIDSGNVKVNSITKLISKRKIENETIMNLDCECFEYIGISRYNQNVTLNYCFSKTTPKIDPALFKRHNDFFLNEYFQNSERPYLKFSVQTDEFKILFLATEINEEKLDSEMFKVK